MRGVFKTVKETMYNNTRRNLCKRMLLYYGGTLFGRVTDNPQSLAKIVLGVMISCMFGRATFISKMLPIAKFKSPCFYEQTRLTTDAINQSTSEVKAIICDGNGNNQAFSRLFDTEPPQPWLTKGCI